MRKTATQLLKLPIPSRKSNPKTITLTTFLTRKSRIKTWINSLIPTTMLQKKNQSRRLSRQWKSNQIANTKQQLIRMWSKLIFKYRLSTQHMSWASLQDAYRVKLSWLLCPWLKQMGMVLYGSVSSVVEVNRSKNLYRQSLTSDFASLNQTRVWRRRIKHLLCA